MPAAAADARSSWPAGLYRRSVAWSLDAVLLAPLVLLTSWRWIVPAAIDWVAQTEALLEHGARALGAAVVSGVPLPLLATALLHDAPLGASIAATQVASWALAWPALVAFALLGAAYHVAAESAGWQGSPGKRLLGLRVCDPRGQPLRTGRALLRHVAGSLSWLTLNLGHALAALGPQHLALHDRCSGTRVLASTAAAPRWAAAWLGLVTMAVVVTMSWLLARGVQVMRAALELALY